MKKIKNALLLITAVLFIGNLQANATPNKIHVVVFKADWCPVCAAHLDRIISEVENQFKQNSKIVFHYRNMTTPETIKKSDKRLIKYNLKNALSDQIYTGMAYVIDDKSKKYLGKISIAEQSFQIRKFIIDKSNNLSPETKLQDETITFLSLEFFAENGGDALKKLDEKAQTLYAKYGFKVIGAMDPVQLYGGPGKANKINVPDRIIIFTAPNTNSLAEVGADPEYQKIIALRNEALKDFMLIETKKLF